MNRRTFFKGLAATAAGILVPGAVLAEPERRVWALDSTMVAPVRDVHFVEQPYLETGFTEFDFRQFNHIPVS
jgi:hypothetical protein